MQDVYTSPGTAEYSRIRFLVLLPRPVNRAKENQNYQKFINQISVHLFENIDFAFG